VKKPRISSTPAFENSSPVYAMIGENNHSCPTSCSIDVYVSVDYGIEVLFMCGSSPSNVDLRMESWTGISLLQVENPCSAPGARDCGVKEFLEPDLKSRTCAESSMRLQIDLVCATISTRDSHSRSYIH